MKNTHLASHILVAEAHDEAVLVSVILVLVLLHQAEASPVVGLSCKTINNKEVFLNICIALQCEI